jgi:adenylate kinase family enzyme
VLRVLVVGITGAGKTTAARRIAAAHDLPFHELDDLAFGPGWQERPGYLDDLVRLAGAPAWVLDSWGDERVRDLLWQRADTVVWLDYPLRVVIRRLLGRSVRRTVRRERIFNGNVESYAEWFSRDHPLRTAWRDFRPRRAATAARTRAFPHLRVVRLRSPAETERWFARSGP